MNRKVTWARFHQSIYVPSLGEVGNTVPSTSKTLDNLAMSSTPNGLLVSCTFRGVKSEFLVPSANVICMSLAPEENVEKTKVFKAVA